MIDEVPGSEIFMNIQSSFRVYKYIYKSSTVIKGEIFLVDFVVATKKIRFFLKKKWVDYPIIS